MSLYNNFELKTKKSAITESIKGIGKKLGSSLVGSAVNKTLNSSLGNLLTSKVAPFGINVDMISTIANDFAGDWVGDLIESQVDKAETLLMKQVRSWLNKIGNGYDGIPEKEKNREFIALSRARKNHFIIQVESNLTGNFSKKMNLFVTDVDLNPMNISGEKRRVGGTFVDTPTGAEATEIRITTMDDTQGTIKKWFEQHCAAVVGSDGTFGVPANYGVTIKVLHAVVDGKNTLGAFTNKGLYRAASYEVQLSRREQAMQEVALTFTQLDSFMR